MRALDRGSLRVVIQFGDLVHVAEGRPDDVVREVHTFLAKVAPQYDLATKLMFSPDYGLLVEELSKHVRFTNSGEFLLSDEEAPTAEAILFVLAAAQVAKRLGLREAGEVEVRRIATALGKAVKTVRNMLTELQKNGLVERAAANSYRITPKGLKEIEARSALKEEATAQSLS